MTKINLRRLGLALSLATGVATMGAATTVPALAQSVGSGSTITANFDTALNTKNATVGEPFKMTITAPSALAGGVIHGHIADVRPAGQGRKAYFTLATDYVALGNGRTANLNGHFTSTGAKAENTTAQKGIGAAAGAAVGSQTIGRLLGGTLGSVVGIAGGAAGGYAYANNKKANLYIDRGFTATVVTDAPVYVRRTQSHY